MESIIKTPTNMETCFEISKNYKVRYKGNWYEIKAKPYEPERQTYQIAWKMIIEEKNSKETYRKWFSEEQENSKLFYPSFS